MVIFPKNLNVASEEHFSQHNKDMIFETTGVVGNEANVLIQEIGSHIKGSIYGVVANVLDFNIVVSEFELQLQSYVHFQTNILVNGKNFLVP